MVQKWRMAMDKTIALPNHEEMLERLTKSEMHKSATEKFISGFYPLLLESAGKEKDAKDIALMLTLAIDDFAEQSTLGKDGDGKTFKAIKSFEKSFMYKHKVPELIDILVDDSEIAQEAKEFFERACDPELAKTV